MYVYIRSESNLYTVGFYDPNGNFIADSDHNNTQNAAARIHWLNGGGGNSATMEEWMQRLVGAVESVTGVLERGR